MKVQTHGNVDMAELRRDIEQRYPGAKIEGLEKQPIIRVVDEEKTFKKEAQKKEQKEAKKEKKEKKKPLIRIIEWFKMSKNGFDPIFDFSARD